jgi:RNA polymerase primary sigma factor|nr:MAG TPA: DNA directed RNA polymerase subunit [Bacteriophage sp.]
MKSFKITQSITDRKDASLGIYFKDVSKLSMITPEKEVELTKRIKLGDKAAANELVTANLRFVISVAKQYQNKGLDLVDLIQEGNIGMLEAAYKFDETRGYRFISYAVWWIRQSIMRAISEQCRTVRVPMSQIVNMSKINKMSEKFEQKNGRAPSMEEIEEETNLNRKKINMSLASTYRSVSLESPLRDEDVSCLLDVLPNDNSESTDTTALKSDLIIEIERILSKLSYREQDVLRMSFGIGVQAMSNDEIANRFGIGGERIRQIQHSAISHIRNKYKNELSELL